MKRNVRGADAVAMRDRRQPLDVSAQQPAERLGLGLAELREVGRHVRDRAMVLADLHARAGLLDRGRVSVGAQRRRQPRWSIFGLGRREHRAVARLRRRQPAARELGQGGVAALVAQVGQRGTSKIVVRVRERRAPRVGEGEQLRGSAASTSLAADPTLRRLAHLPVGDQRVEMAADRRWSQPEPRAQRDRTLRAVLVQRACHPVAAGTSEWIVGAMWG